MSGPHDAVRVEVLVRVSPQRAFELFTTDIDRWWRRGPAYRIRDGVFSLEPGLDGALRERWGPGPDEQFVFGRVLVWEPGARLLLRWRGPNFQPEQATEVELRFEPTPSGTRVCLEHRGWDNLPDDAPVRHGRRGTDFLVWFGSWWSDNLRSAERWAAASLSPSPPTES